MFPRVSDLRHLTSWSRHPFRLLALALVLGAVCVVYGLWAVDVLDHQLRSIPSAMLILLGQFVLLVASSYALGMAVAVFAFGTEWRDTHLIPVKRFERKNPETYLARLSDRTLPYWALTAAVFLTLSVGVHASSGGYLFQFPSRAYPLVSLRADTSAAQLRGLNDLVRKDLDRHLDADALRTRLSELLASDDAQVRAAAAWAVGRTQSVALELHVRQMLADPDPEVRIEAAITEGQLGVIPGLDAVIARLDVETDETVQTALVISLGLARDPAAVPGIVRALPVFADALRPYALWALGEIEDLCTADAVMRYAGPRYPLETRCASLDAMKRLSTPAQLSALDAVFHEEDAWCEQIRWYGRGSSLLEAGVARTIVRAERTRKKAIDAIYNVADASLTEWLASVVNDEGYAHLDRRHARRVYDHLDTTHALRTREAEGCAPTE